MSGARKVLCRMIVDTDDAEFIAALNVTHPATVSTITRTGDKLVFPGGNARDCLCPLCQM